MRGIPRPSLALPTPESPVVGFDARGPHLEHHAARSRELVLVLVLEVLTSHLLEGASRQVGLDHLAGRSKSDKTDQKTQQYQD